MNENRRDPRDMLIIGKKCGLLLGFDQTEVAEGLVRDWIRSKVNIWNSDNSATSLPNISSIKRTPDGKLCVKLQFGGYPSDPEFVWLNVKGYAAFKIKELADNVASFNSYEVTPRPFSKFKHSDAYGESCTDSTKRCHSTPHKKNIY